MNRRDARWLGPLAPGRFPHADSERMEDAPATCPRCKTGVWRIVADGLQCRQCPRRWLVAERLRAMVGYLLEGELAGHWPHHQARARPTG